MLFRAKAPLRIGLAGGGTDVSPYCDLYGGAVLNATISLYAHAAIQPLPGGAEITFEAADRAESVVHPFGPEVPVGKGLALAAGVYNRLVREYGPVPSAFRLTTYVDAPAGSGLGSSSTLVVAIIGAFAEWLRLPLGEYDIAQLAYNIERRDLGMAGGRQDQYAATFGGFNFMEFYAADRVIVNPLRIKAPYRHELEQALLLYFTDTSRLSSTIIEAQKKNVEEKSAASIDAMHAVKEGAQQLKEALLLGRVDHIGAILDEGFLQKKRMAQGISNTRLDAIYEKAKAAGATGGKISGAGGGGFMMFYCPGTVRHAVRAALEGEGGTVRPFDFVEHGLVTWAGG